MRDHDGGEQVDHLDYSAHPSALDRLREVAEGVAAEFDVIALAAVHRTGHLRDRRHRRLVAASAAHRGQAYDASRALIDRLKATVPIWKHQVFADGRDEWVGLRRGRRFPRAPGETGGGRAVLRHTASNFARPAQSVLYDGRCMIGG